MKVYFDFESEAIQPFPDYPPKPTMLGIYAEGAEPFYMSWGHPSGNNCTEELAKAVLTDFWLDPSVELVAQNIAFDMAIAAKHWGLPLQRQGLNHDTMVQAFLLEPHAKSYALKTMGEKHLGIPPAEQDAVHQWLVAQGIVKPAAKDWGAHISKAPAEIVGPYCVQDVRLTKELFEYFEDQVATAKMQDAYARELKLIPIMLQNTLDGICVDVVRLTNDVAMYDTAIDEANRLLFQELGAEPFNIDSDEQLANAIDAAHPGLVWSHTATGKRSTSKANMEKTLEGLTGKLLAIMQYRASLSTCVNTFMRPWLLQAQAAEGRIRCQWNTTRSDAGGTRTGRLSSSPNFMNIPTLKSAKFTRAVALHNEWLSHLPPLPNVRSYIVPDDGEVLVSYDFASQELRVLAHYEDGALLDAYKADPTQDLHQTAADLITQTVGKPFGRKQAKTVAFSILYGSGIRALAEGLGSAVEEAAEIKAAYLEVLPGIKNLQDELKSRARSGLPLRTWGGRVYYVEPPKYMEGRWRTFDYKLLNYLIQGSSADLTKQAIIDYDAARSHSRILITVHDQIVISVPPEHLAAEAKILKDCMESLALDAKLLADGSFGPNLHDVEDLV